MKLVEFSVTNFRSITNAHKVSLQELTVLTGKNNEGKSNLLMALNIAMQLMISNTHPRRMLSKLYDWNRDFPIQKQGNKSALDSVFRLNFLLNSEETDLFYEVMGIKLDQTIPIEIRIGKNNTPRIAVPKRGSAAFAKKSDKITKFVRERISFNYIQAIRTDEMAIGVLNDIIASELRHIDEREEYQTAMKTIYSLQDEVFDDIASRILAPLQEFLPQLKELKIGRARDRYYYNPFLRGGIDIWLNDGTDTSISQKGDGVKSLVSLAILKEVHASEGASIVAIEEPEAHLHPSAIHGLIKVINDLSEKHQVIISTHNPLLIQRNSIKSNILVDSGTARSAKSIKEIRDILGVLPSDNLIHASHVLLVEGKTDVIALQKILPALSPKLKNVLQKNELVIDHLAGASNLKYKLSILRTFMCKVFVFLDDDSSGRESAQSAIDNEFLIDADIKYSCCLGQRDTEFEDYINPNVYKDAVFEEFQVDLETNSFRSSQKWSDRMQRTFSSFGQQWSPRIEKRVKTIIAESIPDNMDLALNQHKRASLDALVVSLEGFVG